MAKYPTTIPQVDSLLGGGITPGTLSCIWVKPGLDGSAFLYQLTNSIAKSNKVFYMINSKSPSIIKEDMKSFGFTAGKINIIDSYSALVGAKTNSPLVVANPKDTEEIISKIQVISKKIKNPVFVLDSLSNLIDLTEKESVDFITQLKKLKITVICLFTEWPYKSTFLKNLKTSLDTIVNVKAVEEKLFLRQYFGVTKANGKPVKQQAIPYRLEKPGGIKIYLPKVLVTGPFNAGKTSFIHSSSTKAVSVDRLGTTIALDHGHVKYKDFAVDLFGTPGQQRFDPILKMLGGEALGVIVVVSAIDRQGFPRAVEMMKKAEVYGLPVVIAANKANLKGALSPAQIKTQMDLKDIEVIPVTAKDLTKVQPGLPCQLKNEDLQKVLETLFTKLMKK
jgi:uncharacterized protein